MLACTAPRRAMRHAALYGAPSPPRMHARAYKHPSIHCETTRVPRMHPDRGLIRPSPLPYRHSLAQVMAVWDFDAAVERRDSTGGTSKRSVLEQAAKLEAWASDAIEPPDTKRQRR